MVFKEHFIKDNMFISTPPTALPAAFGQGLGFSFSRGLSVC